jgi:hypothetical protein
MNEEFSDYEVLVAKYTDGGEITQDISWEVKASTDIVVWCDIAGLMDEGTFDYDGKSITIHAYDRPFIAYIMRKECAEYVISQNSSSTFSVDAILEQLKKNVRILEQLEETDTRTLQCVDKVKPITDKNNRIGKVLSFDDYGNPVCKVEVEDVEKIKTYRNEAQASATSASESATSASTTLLNIQALVEGFDTEVENKQTEVIDAIDLHFSDKLYEKTIEFDEYTDSTISEINGIKDQAQASATKAQASATSASESANQAQALVDKALEIVDPEGFRRDTSANITDLQLFKANTGALHFNGGYVKGNSTAFKGIYNSLTVLQTVKIDSIDLSDNQPDRLFSLGLADIEVYNDDLTVGLISNQVVISVAYSTAKHSDISSRLAINKYNTKAFNMLNDGKYHTIAVVFQTGDYLKFYIDGEFIYQTDTITPYGLNLSTNAYGYGVGGRPDSTSIQPFEHGEISRSAVFNFNAVSEDAPYTIADYQNGKPIPPKAFEYLNQNVAELPIDPTLRTDLSGTPVNQISLWDRLATISVNGNAITWTATDTTTGYPRAIVYKFAKALTGSGFLKVDVGNVSKTGNFDTMRIIIFDITGAFSVPSNTGFGFGKGELSLSIPYTNGLSAIAIGTGSSWEKDDSFTIDYLKVEHNGTILALEDYTITNGTTKMVFDYSGNSNDGTITGNVMGDNDNRVQRLIDFIK